MKYLALLLIFGFGLSGFGQTIKSLGYNTANGNIVYSDTNNLSFTNQAWFRVRNLRIGFEDFYGQLNAGDNGINFSLTRTNGTVFIANFGHTNNSIWFGLPLSFTVTNHAATTRLNLGFSTNLDSLWTATNQQQVVQAIGITNALFVSTNNVILNTNFFFRSDHVKVGLYDVESESAYDTGNIVWVNSQNTARFGDSTSIMRFPSGIAAGGFGINGPSLTISGLGFGTNTNHIRVKLTNINFETAPTFSNTANNTRANLGFDTNLNTLWTAQSTIAARQALGLQSYTNTLTNSVGDVEIGSTVNSVTIGWTISPTNATYALRQLVGVGQTNTITNNSSTLALTSLGLTNDTTWTLTVGDGSGVTNTATTSVNFYNYMTWGRSTNTSLNNAQIQSLHTSGGGASRALSTSRSRSITMDGGGQYLYIAYPQEFGAASFVVGGLPNSAFTAFTNSYTNANGYVTNYLIYRTDTIQNGTGINIVIQ